MIARSCALGPEKIAISKGRASRRGFDDPRTGMLGHRRVCSYLSNAAPAGMPSPAGSQSTRPAAARIWDTDGLMMFSIVVASRPTAAF
jgi:hypothetical protein